MKAPQWFWNLTDFLLNVFFLFLGLALTGLGIYGEIHFSSDGIAIVGFALCTLVAIMGAVVSVSGIVLLSEDVLFLDIMNIMSNMLDRSGKLMLALLYAGVGLGIPCLAFVSSVTHGGSALSSLLGAYILLVFPCYPILSLLYPMVFNQGYNNWIYRWCHLNPARPSGFLV